MFKIIKWVYKRGWVAGYNQACRDTDQNGVPVAPIEDDIWES